MGNEVMTCGACTHALSDTRASCASLGHAACWGPCKCSKTEGVRSVIVHLFDRTMQSMQGPERHHGRLRRHDAQADRDARAPHGRPAARRAQRAQPVQGLLVRRAGDRHLHRQGGRARALPWPLLAVVTLPCLPPCQDCLLHCTRPTLSSLPATSLWAHTTQLTKAPVREASCEVDSAKAGHLLAWWWHTAPESDRVQKQFFPLEPTKCS